MPSAGLVQNDNSGISSTLSVLTGVHQQLPENFYLNEYHNLCHCVHTKISAAASLLLTANRASIPALTYSKIYLY